jgi:hypothetical protein
MNQKEKSMTFYIIDDEGNPKSTGRDIITWGKWMTQKNTRVAFDEVEGVRISTEFLGIDHNFGFIGSPPILWETMVFGGELDEKCRRYASLEEAKAGHAKMVERVFACFKA